MKDAVNAAAGGDGIPTRRIAGDAGREYILQTEEDDKAKAALEAGAFVHTWVLALHVPQLRALVLSQLLSIRAAEIALH